MPFTRIALLLGAIVTCGCEPSKPAGRERPSSAERQARVDSLNRAADERLMQERARVLDEPAAFYGWVERVSILSDSVDSLRVTIRYVLRRDQPGAPPGRMAFVLRGEGSLWRQDRTVLPLDSLKRGDAVRVWPRSSTLFHPMDPPLFPVRAVQRIDSLPVAASREREPARERDMLGKRVLVDIQAWRSASGPKYLDQNFTGVVIAITAEGVMVRRDDTRTVEKVAVRPDDFEVADSEPYILRSTGRVARQPHYTITLTHLDTAAASGSGIGRGVPP